MKWDFFDWNFEIVESFIDTGRDRGIFVYNSISRSTPAAPWLTSTSSRKDRDKLINSIGVFFVAEEDLLLLYHWIVVF
jgi:hypothetical protein